MEYQRIANWSYENGYKDKTTIFNNSEYYYPRRLFGARLFGETTMTVVVTNQIQKLCPRAVDLIKVISKLLMRMSVLP